MLVLYVHIINFYAGHLLGLRDLSAHLPAVVVALRQETAVLEQFALVTESDRVLAVELRLLVYFSLGRLATPVWLLAALVEPILLVCQLDRVKLGGAD